MIEAVGRAVFPFALVSAAALWLKGYSHVGDGFTAGGLAGLGAAVQYFSQPAERAGRLVGARWASHLAVGGLALSLAVLLAPTAFGVDPVTHAPAAGAHVTKLGTLELHTSLLFDAGIALLVYGALVATFDRFFAPGATSRGGEPR